MKRSSAAPVVGCVLVALLFLPTFQNGFVYDDDAVIERGDVIYDPRHVLELFVRPAMYVSPEQRDKARDVDTYRPISVLTFFWDAQLSGREPWSYHLTNLLAHLTALSVFYLLARRVLRRSYVWALLAAAWFTLSPLPQAAHIWINGRSDVLCAIFGGASILVWLRGREAQRSRAERVLLALSGGLLYLAALMCKEIWLGTLPALLFWPGDATPTSSAATGARARITSCAWFFGATGLYMALRVNALSGAHVHESMPGLYLALLRMPVLWLDAAFETLVPTRVYLRCLFYDYRDLPAPLLAGAWLAFAALALWLWRARRRFPIQLWALVWFAGTLAPVAVISTMRWPGFGRYLYVPAMALCLAASDLVARAWDARPGARKGLALAGALYGALLLVRLELWIAQYRGAEPLYRAVIAANPDSPHGWGWLGFWRHNHDQFAAAIPPLEQAYRRDPDRRYLEPLANAYLRAGRPEEALGAALTGARTAPLPSYYMIALNVTHMSKPALAARQIADCLLHDPEAEDCARTYRDLISAHPRAAEYRALFAELLARPAYAPLRARLQGPGTTREGAN